MADQPREQPPHPPPSPALLGRAPEGRADAYVVVLHGGRVRSHRRDRNLMSTSLLRMLPFDRELRARTRGTPGPDGAPGPVVGVQTLRYRFLGWNGAERSPVHDALWAIDLLTGIHGADLPIWLLGHSMGGRVAACVAHERPDAVRGAYLVAPWWPRGEGLLFHPHQRVRVLHGDQDFITSARASRRQVRVLAERGVDAEWAAVRRGGHYMVRTPGLWHASAASWLVDEAVRSAVEHTARRPAYSPSSP